MSFLKVPASLTIPAEAHKKWLDLLRQAQLITQEDAQLQAEAAKGMRLKGRALPPEVIGRNYALYCNLINNMYDAYLNSVHLQRAPYMQEIINVFFKRMYELRDEMVHVIINDYIYVDPALVQLQLTPGDIEIVIPYHFPLECRDKGVEQVLQQMWASAAKRKKKRERPPKPKKEPDIFRSTMTNQVVEIVEEESEEEDEDTLPPSVHTIIPEEFIQSIEIQRHERFRQWRVTDQRAKAAEAKRYFQSTEVEEAPVELKNKAATLIQKIYREYMIIKRQRITDFQRDVMLGLIPDPFTTALKFTEENNKLYERRRKIRCKLQQSYLKELEKENARLLLFQKDNHIEDITDEIRNWVKEWYKGMKFFPDYPYVGEGGTILVVRGDFMTVEEKKEDDERILAETKGKSKEQLKEEKKRAKAEKKLRAEVLKLTQKKDAILAMKAKFDPFSDPGYQLKQSLEMDSLVETLRNYRVSWSLFDHLPPNEFGETIYGYVKSMLTEELMKKIHLDCRKFVDEMMRLDVNMLIQKHQFELKDLGIKYPKAKHKKVRGPPPIPKPVELDEKLFKNSEIIFDLRIVTKPTTKMCDIFGDSKYAAYDFNLRDPDASFPLPGYGDIRNRLVLSCVMGCGIQPGAQRKKAVMLLGPERNGKSFLVDAVAGELRWKKERLDDDAVPATKNNPIFTTDAVKIDISPEVFSAMLPTPAKTLSQAFVLARALQPTVVFMKNIERVFAKKVPPEEKLLNATCLQGPLTKLVKQILPTDKVIFIATCTNPWIAKTHPMLIPFDEVILVPRTDYGSVQQFFFNKLQRIKSIPQSFPIQPLAQMFQGIGFGLIKEVYDDVMTPARIVRLNVTQLSPGEFIEMYLRKGVEPLTLMDYQRYVDFYINNSPLSSDREDYATINIFRADVYLKTAKRNARKP